MTQADAITVPETALVTLCFRANEARRRGGIIDDPMAIRLTDTIDYDFTDLRRSTRQDLALRALAFDNNAHRYLSCHPEATVVALGEGLQTSFWRLDAAGLGDKFRWLTVDLPQQIELRERLLPHSPRISMCAQSALDFTWMDRVNPQKGVFVTAEGLLPYLQPEQALNLIRECARRFPGGEMMFDLPPKFQAILSRHGMRTTPRGGWPSTPFSLSVRELAALAETVPGIQAVHNLPLPRGRGPVFNLLLWRTQRLPLHHLLRRLVGVKYRTVATLTLLEFGSQRLTTAN
jgi:O-methyltransferase involved in polyketide biosynthesis